MSAISKRNVYTAEVRKSGSSTGSANRQPHPRKGLKTFRRWIRGKQPIGSGWYVIYGEIGLHLGLSYPEVYSLVKEHLRSLNRTINDNFLDRELTKGYLQLSHPQPWVIG